MFNLLKQRDFLTVSNFVFVQSEVQYLSNKLDLKNTFDFGTFLKSFGR